ncbi:MAG TPA: WhiB family transcriptional regulator, partial [Jiangellaceae bacterium]|nr:WhiB family transcriptional regulator [Jiangellaceae bacterium]
MTVTGELNHIGADQGFRTGDEWRSMAACRGMETDLFYPEGRGRTLHDREAVAKQVCASCPVAAHCRAAAAEVGERFGIWGGLT